MLSCVRHVLVLFTCASGAALSGCVLWACQYPLNPKPKILKAWALLPLQGLPLGVATAAADTGGGAAAEADAAAVAAARAAERERCAAKAQAQVGFGCVVGLQSA